MSYEDIRTKLQQLDKDSIVLVVSYSSDINRKILDMNYVVRDLSSYSSVPVYHLYNYAMGCGTIGGSVLSGIKEGENAAALALRIINGVNADDIPYLIPEASRNVMDYEQMVRYGISIKDLPEGYEVINKPFSFYETYKTLIFTVIAIIAGLVIFATVLLFNLRRISRMKKNLAENHEELTQLYEELTASDLEMRQQYEKITESNEKIRICEEKLSYLAYHDALTGLPNKLSLYETAKEAFIPGGANAAVLFVDIDNFKNVNDTKGHAFGDQLIIQVSNKLTEILGQSDNIYRLGGDEFIIVLQNIDYETAQKTARKILAEFSVDFYISDNTLRVSVSIGIALFPDHGTTLEQLLKSADIAMYRVKESGKTNYMIYNDKLNELFTERANIDKYMPQALDNHEFELYYQPQYDLKHKKITGFEALLRWHSPQLGEVSPLKFISVAEDNRFIVTLGTWVLQNACEFIGRIHDIGYHELTISVNVSIIQMLQDDFCDIVAQTLKNTGLDSEYLELEITETVLIESMDRIMQVLNQLNEWKVKIVLDDFGKGYSSLSYLKQLPISTLKVDKIFIDGIVSDEDILTGQIVAFGRSMGMKIVAEGVETKQQVEYLERHDCDMLQGYIFSRPKPEADIIKFLNDKATLQTV
jgi:diguanylate cyclase (GGDEF)-like protein